MNDELIDVTIDCNTPTQEKITETDFVENNVTFDSTDNNIDNIDNIDNIANSDTVESLKQTIKELQSEIEAYKIAAQRQEAVAKQINEFSELFPDISVKSIPDEVWENVKQGNSLAAAYSVYERRITEAARRIEQINAQNAKKSAGAVGKDLNQEFFSADDVRKMSPNEVRANYAKIRRSMEKWN
jgi:hypothetical protein